MRWRPRRRPRRRLSVRYGIPSWLVTFGHADQRHFIRQARRSDVRRPAALALRSTGGGELMYLRTALFALVGAVAGFGVGSFEAAPQPGAMEGPGACPFNYAPVCGTDGETHPNPCVAGSHNAGVAYQGICRPGLRITCTRHDAPACGTDRRTYRDRCAALSAGFSVLHDGACNSADILRPERICGGRNGVRCPADQRCDLSSAPRGRLDATGLCVPSRTH
jgi:Kazal-type serine protease inhibitor domain